MTLNEICQWFEKHTMDDLAAAFPAGEIEKGQKTVTFYAVAAALSETNAKFPPTHQTMAALAFGFGYGLRAAEERSLEQMAGVAQAEGGGR